MASSSTVKYTISAKAPPLDFIKTRIAGKLRPGFVETMNKLGQRPIATQRFVLSSILTLTAYCAMQTGQDRQNRRADYHLQLNGP